MSVKVTLKTPSKINLFLRIAGKREDGYHNLETVFLPLKDISDIIEIEFGKGTGISISCLHPEVPCNSSNLCCKAAKLYLETASIDSSLHINIEKKIPVTAGMGGGSSDAGAVLLLMQNHFKALDVKTLSQIALKIGADAPFFLNPLPSFARGVGEVLEPVNLNNEFTIVICSPQFPVSAAWAYRSLVKPCVCENLSASELLNCLKTGDYNKMLKFVKNDLAQALYNKFPLLASIRKDFIDFGLDAAEITGSGPTVFGITRNIESADRVISLMNAKYGSAILVKKSQILIPLHGQA